MWCDRIIRITTDFESAGVDIVDIDWTQCGRVLKSRSRSGEEVRVLLPPGQRLGHGCVIHDAEGRILTVSVRECEMLVARPSGFGEMARLALELGNLHWPTQIDGGEVIFPQDGPTLEIIEKLGIPWSVQMRRFQPTPLISAPVVKLGNGFTVIRSAGGIDQRD